MISDAYEKVLRKRNDAKARHALELVLILDEMNEVRSKCEHKWIFYADASGGSGSSWGCDLCEKWTDINPHKQKPVAPVHKLTNAEYGYTVRQLDEKFPNGWEK